jgi:Regulator of ribonuclease activity B
MNKLNSESNAKVTQTKMGLSEIQIEEAISGHEARNTGLRRVFIAKGVDFGEPRLIECHFWTWRKEDAVGLAEALTTRGFRILAQRPAASSNDPFLWNVEAGIEQSIELTLRREFTDELVRVAAVHSGRYDGWGTHV